MTNTKQELLDQIEKLKQKVDELKEEKGVVRFRNSEGRYFLIDNGGILSYIDTWVSDKEKFDYGNYFKTKEIAEAVAKKRGAKNRLECLSIALNGEVLDYVHGVTQYSLEGGHSLRVVSYELMYCGEVLFKTKELAEQALDLTSNEDLIIMFGAGKSE